MIGAPKEAFDVVVVGGGPAGSSLALRLARAGRSVALLDACAFPRSKPCGDAVSPGATPLLRELGVWAAVRPRPGSGALLEGWRIRTHAGEWFEGRFGQALSGTPSRGLSIDRRELDAALLEVALSRGVSLFERRRVFALEDGPPRTVMARGPDGRIERFQARFVAGADGLRSRIARLLGPVSRGSRPRLALSARFLGVPPGPTWGELRLSDEGVLGYAATSESSCNFTIVIPAAAAPSARPDREAFVRGRIHGYGADALLGYGRLDRPVEVTGPFEVEPCRRTASSLLLVGDAAGYFDPLTGQGVYHALLGARLAAEAIEACLDEPAGSDVALARYERRLDSHLGPSRRLQRLIDLVTSRPRLMTVAARLLGRRPSLATRLVDAAGDRLAPDRLLKPGPWLWAALRSSGTDTLKGRDAYA